MFAGECDSYKRITRDDVNLQYLYIFIVGEVGCGGFAMHCVGRVIVFVGSFGFVKMHISGVQCGVVTVRSKRVAGSKLYTYFHDHNF